MGSAFPMSTVRIYRDCGHGKPHRWIFRIGTRPLTPIVGNYHACIIELICMAGDHSAYNASESIMACLL